MTNQAEVIKDLFPKIVSNTCSEEELKLFFTLLKDAPDADVWQEQLDAWWDGVPVTADADTEKGKELLLRIAAASHTRVVPLWRRTMVWVAAAVVILVIAGTWLFYTTSHRSDHTIARSALSDIQPGGHKATLTLSDGRTVVLDSTAARTITDANGVQIINLAGGQLAYNTAPGASDAPPTFNILTTPRGGQYQVVLPDGSKVWMNAASSLRYPTAFTGKERSVTITGEAYFEVAKKADMPFHVKVNDQMEVEVLGTSFNVNAYNDEAVVHATLLEGSVRVAAARGQQQVLKPGQQALVKNDPDHPLEQDIVVEKADIDKIMAWKNGLFNFENASLKTAMKQLERWYNIDVVYEKGIPPIYFVGKISRNMKLDGVLKTLEESEVHFRMEAGRRLVITP